VGGGGWNNRKVAGEKIIKSAAVERTKVKNKSPVEGEKKEGWERERGWGGNPGGAWGQTPGNVSAKLENLKRGRKKKLW